MAVITSYDTLKTTVADYLARDDLTDYIPNFIQNCQSKLYRSIRWRNMETEFTGITSGGTIAIPSRYLALRHAYVDVTPVQFLERVPVETIYRKYPDRTGDNSVIHMIAQEANTFIFGPYPADDMTIRGVYYQYPQPLETQPTGNWFLDNAPEVLLYGSLLEAEAFIVRDERLPIWQAAYQDALGLLIQQENIEAHSGSSLVQRRA